jgi:hypothetical protein
MPHSLAAGVADFTAAACVRGAFTAAVACAERTIEAVLFMPGAFMAVAAIASPEGRGLPIR